MPTKRGSLRAVIWLDRVRPLHLHGRVNYAYFSKSACPDAGLFSLGEGCSHVAALMFKVECGVRLGYTSSTSQVCKWYSTFTSKVSVMFTPYISKKHCFVVRLNQL